MWNARAHEAKKMCLGVKVKHIFTSGGDCKRLSPMTFKCIPSPSFDKKSEKGDDFQILLLALLLIKTYEHLKFQDNKIRNFGTPNWECWEKVSFGCNPHKESKNIP
jgi:hypothetical protein